MIVAERLQKYLARCGLGSRRACESLITAGEVTVDGRVAGLGESVEEGQRIQWRGRNVAPPLSLVYWMMNKPVGYVSTVSDPQGRPTVMELLPRMDERIFPVGRLDRDSQGLLLFTNDGELTQRLLHPSRHVWKTYLLGLDGRPSETELQRLRAGVELDDGPTAPCRARWLGDCLEVEVQEGRKRQVRRMLAFFGYGTRWLQRVGFGPVGLGDLPEGRCRRLSDREVAALRG